jgi:preprotein translocase subunit SecB
MENNQNQPQFAIQRIYIKDLSFEAPQAPLIFKSDWQPDISVDLNTLANDLEQGSYEVVLRITVTAKLQDKIAYVAEVQQAGIFTLTGFPDDQLKPMLGSYCPNILFPFAREVIADVINRGSFPQFNLAPINFDALYVEHMRQQGVPSDDSTTSVTESSATH